MEKKRLYTEVYDFASLDASQAVLWLHRTKQRLMKFSAKEAKKIYFCSVTRIEQRYTGRSVLEEITTCRLYVFDNKKDRDDFESKTHPQRSTMYSTVQHQFNVQNN